MFATLNIRVPYVTAVDQNGHLEEGITSKGSMDITSKGITFNVKY